MILGRNQQALTMARTRSSRLAGVAVALAIFLAAAATAAATKGPATPTAPAAPAAVGDFAGLVDIGGGRRLYLECRGQGSPTVVLEAGYRNHGGIWSVEPVDGQQPTVLHGVAAFARVCSYDRPGTVLSPEDLSRSDPVPQPRTAQDIVTDLHALLHAAAVAEPYVLVGHSDGGLFVRLYASTYPGEVVGMVLVDAFSEGLKAAMTPEQWATALQLTQVVPLEFASLSLNDVETIDTDAIADRMREAAAARPLPPMPLVVLTAGRLEELPEELAEVLTTAEQASQAFLAALVPNARHIVASESGHYIQLEQPQLVIDAVQRVVAAVHDPRTW